MANFNKVILVGNLTRDVDLKYTPKGTAVANVSLAINRKWKNEAGEAKEEVTFIDLVAFGRTAEVIGQYQKKGHQAFYEGRLHLEQWDDKTTGQKRQKLKVIIETCQLMGGNRAEGNEGSQAAPAARPAARPAAAPGTDNAPDEDDGIPF